MRRLSVLIIIIIAFIFDAGAVRAAEEFEGHELKIARGRISSIDWVKSKIVLQWLSGTAETPSDEVAFYLSTRAVAYKNGKRIPFVDLMISDHVKVHYYIDLLNGEFKAVNVEVLIKDRKIAP